MGFIVTFPFLLFIFTLASLSYLTTHIHHPTFLSFL